jgi:chromate transporter
VLIPGQGRIEWRRPAWKPIAIGAVLWAVPFALLLLWAGWDSLYAQLFRFFTLAALVTFGGAYAVLAYVTDAAVHGFKWITAAQAMDGLALAETTPGPLIMVLQFIGFQATWNQLHSLEAAVLGALIVTYVTFLPSFVLVLAGAPLAEGVRGGALGAVTAAVTGVVLHLAVVFGTAVVRDPFSLILAVAAFAVLLRWKVNIAWIVILGGAIGALRAWLG